MSEQKIKYEHGIEYQCNGVKPDLFDDAWVQIKAAGWGNYARNSQKAGNVDWTTIVRFVVTDDRYKSDIAKKRDELIKQVIEIMNEATENYFFSVTDAATALIDKGWRPTKGESNQ